MKNSIEAMIPSPTSFILLIAALLCMGPSTAAAATWIVDVSGGPGSDFTIIQDAIDTAAPGDLILVRNGVYRSIILSKGLTLAAETGHAPHIQEDSLIENVPMGESVGISGFYVHRLKALDCEGSILVDDCIFHNPKYEVPLVIEYCLQANISRCFVNGETTSSRGVTAASLNYSEVIISDSTFVGGKGEDKDEQSGEPGEDGIRGYSSTLYVQSSSASGGVGGWNSGYSGIGGHGGLGISILYCTMHLFGLEEHVIEGGEGGGSDTGPSGLDRSAVRTMTSTIFYSGVSLVPKGGEPDFWDVSHSNPSVITELSPAVPVITLTGSGEFGGTIKITLTGVSGSTFLIYYSPEWMVLPINYIYTHLHLDPGNLFFFDGGTIPAGAPPAYVIHIPAHLTQYKGMSVYFQAYEVTGTGTPYLSTSASFVLR